MKELDFIPDWYRADRQRKRRRHRHCVPFGLVAALMAAWSFIVGQSVSGLSAETQAIEITLEKGRQAVQDALAMEQEIAALDRLARILEALTPRTTLSAILGELSQCVEEQIVFSQVALTQEPISDDTGKMASSPGGLVRLGATKPAEASSLPDAPQRTRVTLIGIAAGGAEVAQLINRLETSHYFDRVSPVYSRAKKVGAKEVTEFEITCTIADYQVKR